MVVFARPILTDAALADVFAAAIGVLAIVAAIAGAAGSAARIAPRADLSPAGGPIATEAAIATGSPLLGGVEAALSGLAGVAVTIAAMGRGALRRRAVVALPVTAAAARVAAAALAAHHAAAAALALTAVGAFVTIGRLPRAAFAAIAVGFLGIVVFALPAAAAGLAPLVAAPIIIVLHLSSPSEGRIAR